MAAVSSETARPKPGKSPIKKLEALRLALSHAERPLRLQELVMAVEREGYVFQGKVKQHALHNYLYREKPPFLDKTEEGYVLRKTIRS